MSSPSRYYSVLRSRGSVHQYQCNHDVNIVETAMKVVPVTTARGFENYKKIELLKHENLLEILEVVNDAYVLYRSLPNDQYFCRLSEAFGIEYVRLMVIEERAETEEFIHCAMDLLNGLQELHLNNCYHGNLCLETTYIYLGPKSRRPIFLLSGYKFHGGQHFQDMVVKDYRDLATMLETVVKRLALDSWTDDLRFVEVKAFCMSLREGFANRFRMGRVRELIRQYNVFITGHPMLLLEQDRPEYILEAVTYIRAKNLKCSYADAFIKEKPLYDARLGNYLKNYTRINRRPLINVSEKEDPGKFLTDMVRNFLGHKSDNKNNRQLEGIIGSTRNLIDRYFREYQPRIVIALFNVVKDEGFKFQSYKVGGKCENILGFSTR